MGRLIKSHGWLAVAALLVTAAFAAAPPAAQADARSDYLMKLLEGSSQFRVRAQAAISLGAVSPSGTVIGALSRSLKDEHPAVRAAAANALGRLGDGSAGGALRAAAKDSEAPVRAAVQAALARLGSASRGSTTARVGMPSGPARYYVAVGAPGSKETLPPGALDNARRIIASSVSQLDGVLVAPQGETPKQAKGVIRKKKLSGYYIDSAVSSVQRRPDGSVRVAVSVIVATYPGRDMRAILQGAATAMGGGDSTFRQALEGALKGALRKLPQALR